MVTAACRGASMFGAPDRTRTCYPRLRRPVLYPNELRAPCTIKASSREADPAGRRGKEGFGLPTSCSKSTRNHIVSRRSVTITMGRSMRISAIVTLTSPLRVPGAAHDAAPTIVATLRCAIFGVAIGCAAATDAQELAEPPRGVDGVSPAAAPPETKREGRARFVDPADGQFDLGYFLEDPRGFLPIPIVVTEPAVGYGAGAAGMFLRPRREAGERGLGAAGHLRRRRDGHPEWNVGGVRCGCKPLAGRAPAHAGRCGNRTGQSRLLRSRPRIAPRSTRRFATRFSSTAPSSRPTGSLGPSRRGRSDCAMFLPTSIRSCATSRRSRD